MKYLVHARGFTKVVECDTLDNLQPAIRDKFQIAHQADINIQHFDPEWNEWVDVDDVKELPEKGKLKVTVSELITVDMMKDAEGIADEENHQLVHYVVPPTKVDDER